MQSPFSVNDHKTVEQLFKRFEKAGDRAYVQKRQIVDRIIEELSVHAAIEELVFYPVARATVPGTEDIALESLEEHHIVKWLLSELVDLDPTHERFDAKVTVLMENVRHHVEEEESDFFPKVRRELGRTALADLGQALADAKKSAPTHPHPRSPDAPPVNAVVGSDRRRRRPGRRQHQRHRPRRRDGGAGSHRPHPRQRQAQGVTDRHDGRPNQAKNSGRRSAATDGVAADGAQREVRRRQDHRAAVSGAKGTVTSAKKSGSHHGVDRQAGHDHDPPDRERRQQSGRRRPRSGPHRRPLPRQAARSKGQRLAVGSLTASRGSPCRTRRWRRSRRRLRTDQPAADG